MAKKSEEMEINGDINTLLSQLESQLQDCQRQCDCLRSSNLQLREQVSQLQHENLMLKEKQQRYCSQEKFKKEPTTKRSYCSESEKHSECDQKEGLISLSDNGESVNKKCTESESHFTSSTSSHQPTVLKSSSENLKEENDALLERLKTYREDIVALKKWKENAILEAVEKDAILADLEQELIDQQRQFDEAMEECHGHQKVIQELKVTVENQQMPVERGLLLSPRRTLSRMSNETFQSNYARCLDSVDHDDRVAALEQELLETKQHYIQTEADLGRLEETHWALLREYENLQEDFRKLHFIKHNPIREEESLEEKSEKATIKENLELMKEEGLQKDRLIAQLLQEKRQQSILDTPINEDLQDILQELEFRQNEVAEQKKANEQLAQIVTEKRQQLFGPNRSKKSSL